MLKLPDGTIKVLVEGVKRARITEFTQIDDMFSASIDMVDEPEADEKELDILSRSTMHQFEQYIKLNKKVPRNSVFCIRD